MESILIDLTDEEEQNKKIQAPISIEDRIKFFLINNPY